MREAISAVFCHDDEIFIVKRQNYLKAFPGYHSFPGGKVDKSDHLGLEEYEKLASKFSIESYLLKALFREIEEELNFDLLNLFNSSKIDMNHLGIAITPSFNPYRFKSHFVKITVDKKIDFSVDKKEASFGKWIKSKDLLAEFNKAEVLAVPPTIKIIETLGSNINHNEMIDFSLRYDEDTEVPFIESICGVIQFIPLSNTFPPANRTNSFLIGEALIDPSPKNEDEYIKYKNTISKYSFKFIFLTHHHPDHHEFAPRLARELNLPIKLSSDSKQRILNIWGEDYFKKIDLEIINDGDILTSSLGEDVLVYAVPGHDEGQLALAPRNLNWFLAGDLIQTIGTVVVGGDEGDMAKYFNSLQKVIDLNPKIIIPSHGISMGGTYKLKFTLKHRKKREEQVKSLLAEGLNNEEIFNQIYPELDPNLKKYALKSIEAHIKKLASE